MPRTSSSRKILRLRTLVAALLLAAFAFVPSAVLDFAAHAQRAQKNTNTAQQKKPASNKRVFVGTGNSGTRQAFKSDIPLNDYSAYRSGDRFNVVIPNADAKAIGKGGAGRGYSDMKVQQRGNDVVLSYKLQPGAKPRVEQQFNRLEVVFETPEGGAANNAHTQHNAATNNTRTAAQQNQTATRDAQTASPSSSNAATTRTTPAAPNADAQHSSQHASHQQPQPTTTTPNASAPQATTPASATNTAANANANNATAQGQPAATPFEVAQVRQPETSAPGTRANAPATSVATSPSLGATLLRNWPIALALALLLVGFGLFFAARRNSSATDTTDTAEETKPTVVEKAEPAAIEKTEPVALAATEPAPLTETEPATLTAAAMPVAFVDTGKTDEARTEKQRGRKAKKKAAKAKQKLEAPAVAAGQETPPVVSEDTSAATPAVEPSTVVPLVAASVLAGAAATEALADEEKKTEPPAEVAETHAVEETTVEAQAPVAVEPTVEAVAVEEPTVEETVAAEAPVAETVEEPVVEEAAAPTVDEVDAAETPSVEEATVEAPVVEEVAAGDALVDEAAAVEPVVEETTVEESVVEESPSVELTPVEAAPGESSVEAPVEEVAAEDVAEETVEVAAPAAAVVTAIEVAQPVEADAPVVETADAESVQAETRRLLDGERYDRNVLKSADMMARQMVAANLLAALAGRNVERRQRARTAFIEHGFFNESAHDLHYAEAPAARSAAARALALAGDRAATSHLVAALEDNSVDVRRAVVEALADLRDPAAVAPLEELRERQKNYRDKLPRRLLQHAIETCREGVAYVPVVEAVAEPVVETTVETPVEAVAESPVETLEEQAAVVEETAPVEAPEPVIEDSAAWFNLVSAGGASAVEETTEETLVAESQVETTEETAVVESQVAETREETFVAESFAPVVEEEVETPAAVEETAAVEEKEVEPVIEDAAAWFDLVSSGGAPAVEETAVEEARDDVLSLGETTHEATAATEETFVAEAQPAETEEAAPFVEASDATPAWGVESEAATLESFDMPTVVGEQPVEETHAADDSALGAATEDWIELDVEETSFAPAVPVEAEAKSAPAYDATEYTPAPTEIEASTPVAPNRFARQTDAPRSSEEKGVELFDELSTVPKAIQQRITSANTTDRATALADLSRLDSDEAFHQICAAFDDDAREVRNAAARALFDLRPDRADSFTRALRESTPERRRNIGAAINNSGLAADAVGQLTGESREKTYEAFSLLFLMAKAGEVQPLLRAIETHPSSEVRLAVVKLLALSGQKEILPAFRRLAVRGTLPTEVRSAVMEAIYQISSSQDAHSAA